MPKSSGESVSEEHYELLDIFYKDLQTLPHYDPNDINTVFDRAEAYALTVRNFETKQFESLADKNNSYASSPGLAITPLCKPPIRNGMTDCLHKLEAIFVPGQKKRKIEPSPSQLRQAIELLRRLWTLIGEYYTYQLFSCACSQIKYCDVQNPATISYHLARLGQNLMLHPTLLSRIFREAPSSRDLLINLLEPDTHQMRMMREYNRFRSDRPPDYCPNIGEKTSGIISWHFLAAHRQFHHWLHLLAPVWLRIGEQLPSDDFRFHTPTSDCRGVHRSELAEAVVDLHMAHTSSMWSWTANGHSALNAITVSPFTFADGTGDKFLKRWLGINDFTIVTLLLGSLTALQGETFCGLLSRALAEHGWRCPSREVADEILTIMCHFFDRNIEEEIEYEWGSDREKYCVVQLLHSIFEELGSDPFKKASKHSFYSARLAFLAHRLSRHSTKYSNLKNFKNLFDEFDDLSLASTKRYNLLLINASETIRDIDYMGCDYDECLEKERLRKLLKELGTSSCSDEHLLHREVQRLRRKLKICGNCYSAVYCSRECQKADWARHQEEDCGRSNFESEYTVTDDSEDEGRLTYDSSISDKPLLLSRDQVISSLL